MIDQNRRLSSIHSFVNKLKTLKVLVVCTGNICRSPTAEALLRHQLNASGLADRIVLDSAGLAGYHVGDAPSPEAVHCAAARGYDLTGLRARKLTQRDFTDFDLILAMDRGHMRELEALRPQRSACRLALFLEVLPEAGEEVADPYYGTLADYESMLDLIEAATPAWIEAFRQNYLAGHGPGR